ncbi:MAG TPA: serine protease [Gemmatimonadaceae bacterium]|nr:serine protease [Gemmatimonadaceae bacterium]
MITASALRGQESGRTSEVFRHFADRVVKIQVVETGSAAKATLGSGFFVDGTGRVVTNYHVVSKLINSPDRYRAEMIDVSGASHPVKVLGVNVVDDLAVLSTDARDHTHFTLAHDSIAQGARVYSLGHPEDLGLSIVEGTYNGYLPHARQPRLHFTGSLNHGMSGGPTLTEDGRVIGINVATEGEELSFLVPVERAVELLEHVLSPGKTPAATTLTQVGEQLREYQDAYLHDMFTANVKTIALGPFRVLTEPAPFFRCWADANRRKDLPYEVVTHRCSTDDYVFIAGDQSSGVVTMEHQLISTKTLNSLRFFSVYTSYFKSDNTPGGEEEHVTSWRCATRNVRNADTPMRSVLCLRRYRKLGELYDAVLKVAVLGRGNVGLVSTLTMSGVTFDNVEKLSQRYLEHVTWR